MRPGGLHPLSRARPRSSRGWVLLDVMVAVLVAGVLIGPLAGAVLSGLNQSARVRQQAEDLSAASLEATSMADWTWGSVVVSAQWLPGPALEVIPYRFDKSVTPFVGLWIDGWFCGEWQADPGGSLSLSSATWAGWEGREAVVRVRAAEGAWGPPWRSLVADSRGVVADVQAGGPTGSGAGEVVVHAPSAANPLVEASWAQAPLTSASPPLIAEDVPAAPSTIAMDESLQSWVMEAERGLDVYY
jgi:hypothetical protein